MPLVTRFAFERLCPVCGRETRFVERYRKWGYPIGKHLYFFSKPTLTRMLGRVGFEVIECSHPWKIVPLDLMVFQLLRVFGLPNRALPRLGNLGIPINLFDAFRLVARRVE